MYDLIKKGATWDETVEKAFTATKRAVEQVRALQVRDPGKPFELDVYVTAEDMSGAYGSTENKVGPRWAFGPIFASTCVAGAPTNWEAYYSQCICIKWTPWSYYLLVIFLPATGDVVTALAEHTARALTYKAFRLVTDEVAPCIAVVACGTELCSPTAITCQAYGDIREEP